MNGWNTIRIMSRIMCHVQILGFFISTCSIGALTQANSLPDPRHQYFPPGAFETAIPRGDNSRAVWYSCALAALAEPSLFESRDDNALQTYRFLWLRSFHRPVSVRLTVDSEGNGVIVTKISDGAGGGYKPGKLVTNTTAEASREQVQDVLEQLRKLDFWSMQTEPSHANSQAREPTPGYRVVTPPPVDGAQWILEGLRNGNYHVVDRWSPGNDAYAQLCKLILQLGGVKEKDIY